LIVSPDHPPCATIDQSQLSGGRTPVSLIETVSMSAVDTRYAVDVEIPSDANLARKLQEEIEEALKSHRYCERDIFGIRLAIEEALVNAIKHGNQMDRTKKVRVAYRVESDRFDVLIADEGQGFDPNDLPDPTAVENLERPCGRGVMLMRHYMTVVDYRDRGNTVCMSKIRNGNK
jgi:serine/threonine-protein kinase RsbW